MKKIDLPKRIYTGLLVLIMSSSSVFGQDGPTQKDTVSWLSTFFNGQLESVISTHWINDCKIQYTVAGSDDTKFIKEIDFTKLSAENFSLVTYDSSSYGDNIIIKHPTAIQSKGPSNSQPRRQERTVLDTNGKTGARGIKAMSHLAKLCNADALDETF